MGQSPVARRRLAAMLKLDKPAVLDADALNLLAAGREWPGRVQLRAVLTPHPGEMRRLASLLGIKWDASDAARVTIACAAARLTSQTVLLKGHRSAVCDGRRLYLNRTGDSTLSKAGSGDVLAGIIGCFLAQRMDVFSAACLGACIHGLCGEQAGRDLTRRCPLARDLTDRLPVVLRRLEARSIA